MMERLLKSSPTWPNGLTMWYMYHTSSASYTEPHNFHRQWYKTPNKDCVNVCMCLFVSLSNFISCLCTSNPNPPPLLQISSLLLLFNGNEYDKNGLCWWQFRKRCSILDWRNSYTNSQHCWCFWWVEFKKDYLNLNIFIHKTENFERNILGNIICIWVLTKKKKELGLKPSFTNLLILLVSLVTSP